jgi:hypothetical protein
MVIMTEILSQHAGLFTAKYHHKYHRRLLTELRCTAAMDTFAWKETVNVSLCILYIG